MSKQRQSEADLVWKEKADLVVSQGDVIVTVVLALALIGALCVLNL